MTDILSQLNDSQRQAVEYCDGPELVIAGAGSGKTRVLTYKIAYLLQNTELGLMPWNVLALTFTNKAANEMKQRIAHLVGESSARYLRMGTFHSVFSRILRAEATVLGYTSNYTIYDDSDSKALVGTIIKELELDGTIYKPANVHARISRAKNQLYDAAAYKDDGAMTEADTRNLMPDLYRVFEVYEQRCKRSNAMDFDDLLVNTFRLFHLHKDVCDKYADQFKYILVDEYQDTNYAQQTIVKMLSAKNGRICVVGDDAQSIYGFRGANIDNMLDFDSHFAGVKVFKLEQNYRSTQFIVQAANSLISHNQRQLPKNVYSMNDKGSKLAFYQAPSDRLEAKKVCDEIKRLRRQEGGEYSDFAVLYRTNAQSRCFEEEMHKQAIPYRIYGGLSFYQRKEIKDIIAYFRVVVNPDDEEAMLRIINYPARGIGNTTVQHLSSAAANAGVSLWEVICHPLQYGANVNSRAINKLTEFALMLSPFIERSETDDAYTLGKDIIVRSGIYADLFGSSEPENVSKQQNVEEFAGVLHDFVDTKLEEGEDEQTRLSNFIQEVALLTDKDSDDEEQSRVTLTTIHLSKGLEFPTVFIVGLEENIFPGQRSVSKPRLLEEERRLFYVAITRAEKHCYLSCAKTRYRYGEMERDIPSRFIKDIDPQYINELEPDSYSGPSFSPRSSWRETESVRPKTSLSSRMANMPDKPQQNFSNVQNLGSHVSRLRIDNPKTVSEPQTSIRSKAGNISIGTFINHERFGLGEVMKIEGTGENAKITVRFQEIGSKQLLLKFARFSIAK